MVVFSLKPKFRHTYQGIDTWWQHWKGTPGAMPAACLRKVDMQEDGIALFVCDSDDDLYLAQRGLCRGPAL